MALICKYGNTCWNKMCNDNHPIRLFCKYGSSCIEFGCWFNHIQPLCPTYNNCTDQKCQSRHTQKKKKHNLLLQEKEAQVISNHKNYIPELINQIESVKSSCDPENMDSESVLSTIEAIEAKIQQLEKQLSAYEFIKKQIRENVRKELRDEQIQRELYRLETKLPALAKRQEVNTFIGPGRQHRFIIIQGQTGSGKSTQIPQYAADHPRFLGKRIICTQPRKIAAISLAKHVAFEYSAGDKTAATAEVGCKVGYRVPGDKQVTYNCRIEYVTESVMLNWILKGDTTVTNRRSRKKKNPFEDIGCIIIDEAHERSVTCDLLLGSFKKDDPRWKHILFIISSATIDLEMFSTFFNNAPSIQIEGRTFPVQISYKPLRLEDSIDLKDVINATVKLALEIHVSCEEKAGDILCFLPSQDSVLTAADLFERESKKPPKGAAAAAANAKYLVPKILPLFGRQEPEAQAEVFKPVPKTVRKIIFSTDLAETSVTIDGVVYVIDCGLKKDLTYDPKRKISSLKLQKICKSSAIQRAGRSGRTQPGYCYRLYSEDEFETMEINSLPEILRKPLSLAILTLRDMNIDPHQFDWISQPSLQALQVAEEELILLGAIAIDEEEQTKLTDLGRMISQVQQEPSLVRMINFACQLGFGEAALKISGILSVSNIFFWKGTDKNSKAKAQECQAKFMLEDGDLVSMYRVFEEWSGIIKGKSNRAGAGSPQMAKNPNILRKAGSDWCRTNCVNNKALGIVSSTVLELKSYFKKTNSWTAKKQAELPSNDDLKRIVFSGQFLNTSCLLKSKSRQAQYCTLQTDVIGTQSYGSAIMVAAAKSEQQNQKPEWIVYDKLLRLELTLLITTTPIQQSWLEEENPEFAALCRTKHEFLPISFTKTYSTEILRVLFGKYFCKLDNLEQELQCSIEGHLDAGTITIYCDRIAEQDICQKLETKVQRIKEEFKVAVSEEEYLGGTRVIVGEGYQVKEVLFPMEYIKIYIRNLPIDLNKRNFQWLIEEKCGNLGNNSMAVIRTIEWVNLHQGLMAVVMFNSKHQAKTAAEKITGAIIDGCKLAVSPGGSLRRGVSQQINGRLKLSWATGHSKQTAKLWFDSARSANSFIENSTAFLKGARILSVHGQLPSSQVNSRNRNQHQQQERVPKKPQPPLMKLHIPRGTPNNKRGQYFRFDEDRIALMPDSQTADFDFSVSIADISVNMDEIGIMSSLRHLNLKGVKVDRMSSVAGGDDGEESLLSLAAIAAEEKATGKARLDQIRGLTKHITADSKIIDFVEKSTVRSGYYIFFDQVGTLRQAYLDILGSAAWKAMTNPYGQPQRLEMDYIFTASIHVDLYKFVKLDLERLEEFAKANGAAAVHKTEPKNGSKFFIMRFRSNSTGLFQKLQIKLDEISSYIKIAGENVRLLFTNNYGRELVQKLGNRAFLHWNYKSAEVLIYGRPHIQKQYEQNLNEIIDKLKTLDLLDYPINLNRKTVDLRRRRDTLKISELCQKAGIKFHRFNGNKLYVSGMADSIKQLENKLAMNKLSFTMRSQVKFNPKEECGICFCPPENGKFIIAASCQHLFCIECIQPLFDQHEIPIKCPAEHDQPSRLFLVDINKVAPLSSLPTMLEIAVKKYQEQNVNEVKICPKPGCNQLLSSESITTGPFGGEFIFCNVCVSSYCLKCTEKLNKPIQMHEEESCNEIQTGSSGQAQAFVRKIQDTILNLSCPRCNTVFLEFDGCAAVFCSNCQCGFCGICLKDCGTDAHGHVALHCKLNPSFGQLFINAVDLNQAQSKMRTEKLKLFLNTNVNDLEVRKIVIRNLCKDLIDLGMDWTEV